MLPPPYDGESVRACSSRVLSRRRTRADELAKALQADFGFGHIACLEEMLHAVIDLDAHGYRGVGRAIAQTRSIVAQDFRAAGMHHDRRKILEAGEGRRSIGIARIGFLEIVPCADEEQIPSQCV